MSAPHPKCPIRPGESCGLCVPGATGPADCGLVYLVMSDPQLRADLAQLRADLRAEPDAGPEAATGSAPV